MALPSFATNDALLSAAASGLLAHQFFLRNEPRNPMVWLTLILGLPLLVSIYLDSGAFIFLHFSRSTVVHNAALLLSIVVYRLSPLHPLAKYPGPWTARASPLFMIRMARSGKRHIEVQELHKRYGTHVRLGPNTLSVVDVEAIKDCLGTQGMPRPVYYRFSDKQPLNLITSSSVTVPDHDKIHASKRKIWNQAFTGTSIKEYDSPIDKRSSLLVARLGEQEGVVDLGKWISYFTFDFMGDIVFGGGFEMMRDGGDVNGFWKFIIEAVGSINILNHFEWTGRLFELLPASKGALRMNQFAKERVAIRANRGPITKDIYYHIAEDDHNLGEGYTIPKKEVVDEMAVAIIAGADTTSSVLANAFYSLLSDSDAYRKLQQEIDREFGDEDPADATKLSNLPYLNAVINEALRLYPAVPFSVARTPEPGTGGKMVAGKFVPEGTTVYIPFGPLQRDFRYFSPDPDVFRPERWIEKGKGILNREAFNPFSYGPGNCVGKHLAYREMRVVLAKIIQRYDLEFEKEYDPQEWLDSLLDETVFVKGRLPVKLTKRKAGE